MKDRSSGFAATRLSSRAACERFGKSSLIPVPWWSFPCFPVLPDGRIVLIRQFRYAAKQYLWELVAGRIDAGESPKVAAARELIEETGYRAKRFRVFLDVFPTPGFLEERMFILLAEGLTAGEAEPEEDEKIVSGAYNRKELEEMIRGGKLRDAKSIAGILYYLRFLAPAKR